MIDKYTDPDENNEVTYVLYYGDIKTLTYNDTTYYFLDERGIPYGDDKCIDFY